MKKNESERNINRKIDRDNELKKRDKLCVCASEIDRERIDCSRLHTKPFNANIFILMKAYILCLMAYQPLWII